MSQVNGPDFLGLQRVPGTPPGLVAFHTSPIPFAVREIMPGTDLDAGPVGLGVSLSLSADDSQALHDQLRGHGVPILMDPFDTPFGRTFVFQDPDGYAIAIHGTPPAPAP
jgi:Glyoxalase/Bleomycin resistance protein/Dioxygenase superfamily